MKITNRITDLLGIDYPIVQAPMGWIARSALASAVSNAGGLGIIETSSGELDAVKAEVTIARRLFHEQRWPVIDVTRRSIEETAAAITVGLRYGKGLLYMKKRPTMRVFWQGPSVGFDLRINASRVFTLCYNLQYPDAIFQRFPGVEGSAYFIGGLGVNYQRANEITLAPVRAGVGFGAGANIGYLAYSRHRSWIPF